MLYIPNIENMTFPLPPKKNQTDELERKYDKDIEVGNHDRDFYPPQLVYTHHINNNRDRMIEYGTWISLLDKLNYLDLVCKNSTCWH